MTRRVLLLGLGNGLLSDDAVGIHAVRLAHGEAVADGIEVAEAELAGFALLDLLEGFDAAVVVDAVRVEGLSAGEIVVFDPLRERPSLHLVSGHQIDLPTALELGALLDVRLPTETWVVGVQVEDDQTFCERCTPAVERSVPAAAAEALAIARRLRLGRERAVAPVAPGVQ